MTKPIPSASRRPPAAGGSADRALGYALTLPAGWTDSAVPAGATRPFGGAGRGCAIGIAGILGDTRGDRLVGVRAPDRRAARRQGRARPARAVQGANVPGARGGGVGRAASRPARRCS